MRWQCGRALLGGGWLAAVACAASAQVPDAGRILRESTPPQPIRPAPPTALQLPPAAPVPANAPNQPSFVLKSVKLNGNTVFSSSTLQALVADRLGQSVTLADLQLLAARVTAYYRNADYVLTQTVVPVQDVTGGQVEFSVLEGRLGRIKIERVNEVPIPDSMIEGVVSGLPKGRPLTQHELERAVLMLSDIPGMATQVSLEAGDESGTYDLIIEVKAAPPYSLSVDLDNQGSRATGEYRIGAMGRINSPFGRGDNLDLRLLNSFGKGLTFGRAAYELPIGYSGLRASLAYARVQYELGKDFAALDAYGTADVVELAATYPLLRSRIQNLFGKVTLEFKQLNDQVGAAGLASKKRTQNLGVGFVYERRDNQLGGGYVSAGLTGYAGKLDIRSQADLLADQDIFGRHTNGNFARASYQLSRLQALSATTSAYLAIAGQWANKNLDSADKIAVGGPRTVRAFSSSTGIGDEARILNAELRWSVTPDASVSAFYDIGQVRTNHTAAAGEDNHRTLSGYGLGLYWTVAGGMALRASLAWPYLNTGTSATGKDERSPRAFGQIVKMF
ncbi:MAG: peptide transporter permease [Massilia sp.]|nr:peptide transporter permease [Massilia sp.]